MDMIRPYIDLTFNSPVWRMETDHSSSNLFLEIRDESTKQVSFASVNLALGTTNFVSLTTPERWLTGMEKASNGILLLHHYQSASGPAHKSVIAIDGFTGNTLWSNYNYAFDHFTINGPVLFDTRLQPRKLFLVDIVNGATLRAYQPSIDLEADTGVTIPDMITVYDKLPETPYGNIVHQLFYKHYRIVSLHTLNTDGRLTQRLYILNRDTILYTDLLNTGIQKLQPEAFVMQGNHLIYLKNKSQLKVINL